MVCLNRKHLKRVAAPSQWMLNKLGGNFAPKPSAGPVQARSCLPLILLIRNKLKYALNYDETKKIVKSRHIKVNGKVRTDVTFPLGVLDVIEIEATKDKFRIVLDTLGRFRVIRISPEEAKLKPCRVDTIKIGSHGIPHAVTNDGRTIRFIHPEIKRHDTIMLNLETSKISEHIPLNLGCLMLAIRGKNVGRIGKLTYIDRIFGSKDLVHLQDSKGREFITTLDATIVIGNGINSKKPFTPVIKWLPSSGIKKTTIEHRLHQLKKARTHKDS